jgi:hypothetical protein
MPRLARRGIWKDGTDAETPAEYKKRTAAAAAAESPPPLAEVAEAPAKRGARKPAANDALPGTAPMRRSMKAADARAKADTGAKGVLNRAVDGFFGRSR